MATDIQVKGTSTNCKGNWDTMLSVTDAGFKGLVKIANRVFYSLNLGPEFEDQREDIVQEALITLYVNAEAWDTNRSFVSWASVVLRNSMIRSMQSRVRSSELTYDPHTVDQASDEDAFEHLVDSELAKTIYRKANDRTKNVLNKVMAGKSLTRNEYYILDEFRRRIRESTDE